MTHPLRFGVWAPVYGAWGSYQHPDDPPNASYRRSRDLVVRAEALGFDAVLLAQHVVNPSFKDEAILETWTAAAGIAEATERIEIITPSSRCCSTPACWPRWRWVSTTSAVGAWPSTS